MSFGFAAITPIAAVLSANNDLGEKHHQSIQTDSPIRWLRFESLCGEYRVDFSENDSRLVDCDRILKDVIIFNDIKFKLIDSFSRLPNGRIDI